MKNKKWIILCAVILVILAVLLIWKPFGKETAKTGEAKETAESEAAEQQAEQQTAAADAEKSDAETAAEETQTEEETSVPVILEDGGDLEIIIPDDEESAGF